MEAMTATSPDGRSWKIEPIKEPFSIPRSQIVVTVIVLGMAIFLAWISWYFALGLGIILLIWVCGRISNHMRPRFRARTEGPPPEELNWKATSFAGKELEQRIAREIGGGLVNLQPSGLKLRSR